MISVIFSQTSCYFTEAFMFTSLSGIKVSWIQAVRLYYSLKDFFFKSCHKETSLLTFLSLCYLCWTPVHVIFGI